MQDEYYARCIFAQMPAISIWTAVQLSRLSILHELSSTDTANYAPPTSSPMRPQRRRLGVPSLPHSQPTAGRPASPWGTAFRIEGLEVSLNHAREIAVREELDAVGHYIEEAQGYLAQIRVLHEEALNEFSRAQGE